MSTAPSLRRCETWPIGESLAPQWRSNGRPFPPQHFHNLRLRLRPRSSLSPRTDPAESPFQAATHRGPAVAKKLEALSWGGVQVRARTVAWAKTRLHRRTDD